MPQTIKVKLREGDREIEVEGSPAQVDRLLAKWWLAGRSTTGATPLHPPKPADGLSPELPQPEDAEGAVNDPVDATVLAIQGDAKFRSVERHVLHAPSHINKVRLVCFFAAQPLTTGEIRKVLVRLGVRIHLSGVSHTVEKFAVDFIPDKRRRSGVLSRYQLTGKAYREFKHWLNSDG